MMEVSVVIPVYNAARFVEEAVGSALAQPETAEVILIEDNSPDDSLTVCTRLAEHKRVRLLRHPGGKNLGAAESRNVGVRAARCEYIAFLDADDLFLPERFRVARPLLEDHPDADGVYEAIGAVYEDESLRKFWHARRMPDLYTMNEPIEPDCLFAALVRGQHGEFSTDGVTVRKRIFEKTGLFDPHLRMCQDTAMWVKMAAKGRLLPGSLTEPVSVRRVHRENRIYEHRDQHMNFRTDMYRTLIRWGTAGNLTRQQVFQLLEAFMDHWYWHVPAQRGWSPRRLRLEWLLFVLATGVRYPVGLWSADYRHRLGQACGLGGASRWLAHLGIRYRTRH